MSGTGRYDVVRILGELPVETFLAAVELKTGTSQPPCVTFFVVEYLDTIARSGSAEYENDSTELQVELGIQLESISPGMC